MPAPTFIQEAETDWNTNTDPKSTASFDVLAGDILVAYSMTKDHDLMGVVTITGGSLIWTVEKSHAVSGYCGVVLATAVVDTNKSMTVTFNPASGGAAGENHGGNCLTFRNSDGIGASAKANASGAGPTVNLTTTQLNSAIVLVNADWIPVDGASRTWRTNAGALTEQTYFFLNPDYTCYGGYHADAGAIGTYAVGLSAPSTQKYTLAAVEVKGSVAGGFRSLMLTAAGR